MNNAAIGIFDSGLGGLTVAREIAGLLSAESLIYVGDQARCPYGSRDADQVREYVQQITDFLVSQQVKMIVIACNTATACGLQAARQRADIPVVGVIDAGARAALAASKSGNIAVIGTERTVNSDAYPHAVARINSSAQVVASATPELAGIVESGLEDQMMHQTSDGGEYYHLAESYLQPLFEEGTKDRPDTLLLGCTHYPVLSQALQRAAGSDVAIVCAGSEVAAEVQQTLKDGDQLASKQNRPHHVFYTTDDNIAEFDQLGSKIFGTDLTDIRHLQLEGGKV
ncbi:MAG: glutamate racemase [Coriobacteriia bacterium]|nr:glutamate racemase [Coriobacteriia bacterium]